MNPLAELLHNLTDFQDVGLLAMRLLVGFVFITAGGNKSEGIRKFAAKNGLPVPIAYALATTELLAGFAIALGLFTPLAALAIMGVMTGSMSFHIFKWKSPYWASEGGWEYDLMLFTMAGVILLTGGGQLAIYPLG